MSEELGARLARARRSRALTQAALALRVGVQSTQVSRWERGIDKPSFEHFGRVARELRVSMEWLATGQERAARRRAS